MNCMTPRFVTQENMVMSPAGLGTKNDCACKGQQQFTRPTDRPTDFTRISATDQIFYSWHEMEIMWEYNGVVYQLFVKASLFCCS
jgi:hypothetical protein